MSDVKAFTALNIRVWYVEGGVHPSRSPQLLTLGKFSGDPAQSVGEDARITAPDPNNFNSDLEVGTVPGSKERATFSIGTRMGDTRSILLDWKNKRCRVDFFGLAGRCGNPQDFSNGGEKFVFFQDGKPSNHGYENFGAYGTDENNPTNEAVDFNAEDYWEFLMLGQDQIGQSSTTREIYAVDVYTGNACEACPEPCDRVLAAMAGTAATPGTRPSLLSSQDAGETFTQQDITALFSNEEIVDGEVVGGDIVYLSNTGNVLVWTVIEQIFETTNLWNRVSTGFVAAKGPRAMWSSDPRHTWIVGDGGYIYLCRNPHVGVEVQDAGVSTTQNLQAVHAYDNSNILTVGNANAVIYSLNGGVNWKAVTGPVVGVNLGACWMWDTSTWIVGEGAGGAGRLWLTTNRGRTWTQILLPISGQRIDKIKFVSEAEGYISLRSGGQSYILRTITAGAEWIVLPQGRTALAVGNSYLRDIAICSKFANTAFAAGLASNLSAGIILKMTA